MLLKTTLTFAGPTYFFKESPFFEVRESIMTNITLDGMCASRHVCSRLTQSSFT